MIDAPSSLDFSSPYLIFALYRSFLLVFQAFREHNIDGSALVLLTDDHLTKRLGMKLGPALKLRSAIQKKVGNMGEMCIHCSHCRVRMQKSILEQRSSANNSGEQNASTATSSSSNNDSVPRPSSRGSEKS